MLEYFIKWANELAGKLSLQGFGATVSVGEPSDNRAARIDIDSDKLVGRITFWDDGSFHAEVVEIESEADAFRCSGKSNIETSFDELFHDFLSLFSVVSPDSRC